MSIFNNADFSQIVDELFQNQFSPELIKTGNLFFCDNMQEAKVKTEWILPLVKLVFEFIDNENPQYKKIYSGERLFRPFSPHVSNEFRKFYFDTIIDRDIEIYIKYFGQSERITSIHELLKIEKTSDEISITTYGDCIMAQVNSIVAIYALEAGIGITSNENYIGAYYEQSKFDPSTKVQLNNQTKINVVAISPFTYWGIPSFRLLMKRLWASDIEEEEACTLIDMILEFVEYYVNSIREETRALIFLHNSAGLPWLVPNIYLDYFPWNASSPGNVGAIQKYIGKINNRLDIFARSNNSIFLVDERKICSQIEKGKLYFNLLSENILNGSIFHYNQFCFYIAEQYIDLLKSIKEISSVKVLFVDFDNTLWLGNIAEGKVDHIPVRQKIISDLYSAGILLIALSKNYEKNIPWSEISIDYDHFSLLKINWNTKVTNIIQAVEELNISLDQTMVLDDSEEEMGLIKSHLPTVRVLDSKLESSWELLKILLQYSESTGSSRKNRTKVYRGNLKRKDYLKSENSTVVQTPDLKKLLKPLNIVLKVNFASEVDILRIYELAQRTNQFNSSRKTFTLAELRELVTKSDWKILVFNLTDSFGDMGLIGVVFIKYNPDYCCIEKFILSCRAMGYCVEKSIMQFLIHNFLKTNIIKAILMETEKNFPIQEFYQYFGFIKGEENDTRILSTQKRSYESLEWIRLEIGTSVEAFMSTSPVI